MKQNIIKRILPSACVLHKAKAQRSAGALQVRVKLWEGTFRELNMDSTVKRSCSRRTFQGLQALFPWTRDTTRTALTFVDAQIGEM